MTRRAAILSYHSSPLLEPGAGDSGGMTIFVRALTKALALRGLGTDVYTRSTGVDERVIELFDGVRVIGIEAGPTATAPKEDLAAHLEDFATGVRAFAAGQRVPYDVIHSHYWQSGVAGTILADAWKVPLVHSHHTLGLVKNRFLAPGDVPEPETRLAGERKVIDGADVLVASTDEEWEQLACLYGAPHDRLKTIHPGVDHDVFSPGDSKLARRELGLGDELTILYAGRIQRLKGLELAIRAVEQLVPAFDRRVSLLIVGGASGRGGDEEVARLRRVVGDLGLDDVVRFVGPQPHSRLASFYRVADAVVVCSHSESFGLAALEAHACGTPVVATPVGGLSHIVADGKSGFLVDTRDPAVFAGRLKTLLADNDLRRSFGSNAALRARAFSWESTADQLYWLYDCLIQETVREVCTC